MRPSTSLWYLGTYSAEVCTDSCRSPAPSLASRHGSVRPELLVPTANEMVVARMSPWFATILLHQRLDKFSLFFTEHVCRCVEAVILVSEIYCEARL